MSVIVVVSIVCLALATGRVAWDIHAAKRSPGRRTRRTPIADSEMSLHQACYGGRLERVRTLLATGADPNRQADTGEPWVYRADRRPRPLNCVAIAHVMTDAHVAIARLLVEHRAVVDATVLGDHAAECVGSEIDRRLVAVLEAARRP